MLDKLLKGLMEFGRGERIRTSDHLHPINQLAQFLSEKTRLLCRMYQEVKPLFSEPIVTAQGAASKIIGNADPVNRHDTLSIRNS